MKSFHPLVFTDCVFSLIWKSRSFHTHVQKGGFSVRNMKFAYSLPDLFWATLMASSQAGWTVSCTFMCHIFLHQPTFFCSLEVHTKLCLSIHTGYWRKQGKTKTYHLIQRLLWKSSSCWEEAEWSNQRFLLLGPGNEHRQKEISHWRCSGRLMSFYPSWAECVCLW